MKISRNLAVAMVNADTSGLNETEIELIKNFPDFTVLHWNDDSTDINGQCSITGLYDHCVEIELTEEDDSGDWGVSCFIPDHLKG